MLQCVRSENLHGIKSAILQEENGRDPIDNFIRGLLHTIHRLDDSADGENLSGKRKGNTLSIALLGSS